MPWCPKCETEYREGFDTCTDCGAALTEALPENQPKPSSAIKREVNEPALLTTAEDDTQAGMLAAMLGSYGIPVKKIYLDSGSFLKVYSGKTVFGVELYVPRDCLEEAAALLEADALPEQEIFPDDPEEDESLEQDEPLPSLSTYIPPLPFDLGDKIFDFVNGGDGSRRRIIAWLVIFPFISGVILFALALLANLILPLFAGLL